MNRFGVLPRQTIREMIESGSIQAEEEIPEDNIQPSSLDLRIAAGEVIRLPGAFSPNVPNFIDFARTLSNKHNYFNQVIKGGDSFVLEVGVPYLFRNMEWLELPDDACGKTDNKSTSGRINLQVRTIAPGHHEFDVIPRGYKGELYSLIMAKSFPIKLSPGSSLNQLRISNGPMENAILDNLNLEIQHRKHCLVYDLDGQKMDWTNVLKAQNGGIILTANLKSVRGDGIIGHRFKGAATYALEFNRTNHCPLNFFEPIFEPPDGEPIVLAEGDFTILSSGEAFSVPGQFCSVMVPHDSAIAEARSHWAGFFDPGWGWTNGRKGTAAVFEINPHENILVFHNQPICVMQMYRMTERPDVLYGEKAVKSHYPDQKGPKLSKHFDDFFKSKTAVPPLTSAAPIV
ncbi:MAG: 2'-deoxycytidine 5'-triphosphate deaminase [Patescibacteria group bacterium]|nr:2'-deoxycytidine 5'-triphosphate deaminase [Patescibacteria group bacterium]